MASRLSWSFLDGVGAAHGEVADFLGDDREALAGLAGPRGLDVGVEREEVDLEGNSSIALTIFLISSALLLMSPIAMTRFCIWVLPCSAFPLAFFARLFTVPALSVFSLVWLAISVIDDVISSSDEACSVAPCDSDWLACETWREPSATWSTAMLTWLSVSLNASRESFRAVLRMSKSPLY